MQGENQQTQLHLASPSQGVLWALRHWPLQLLQWKQPNNHIHNKQTTVNTLQELVRGLHSISLLL